MNALKSQPPKPALGVCYYPEQWPEDIWVNDARRMAECGLSLVRIGEFAWSRIEPEPGKFDFVWLDRAIETLGDAGLKVVMCTPTATPPKWLVDRMPDMIAIDEKGRPRKFGSRRHYCFSHLGYRAEAARITELVARRYGGNEHVVAWQTDNEYGCHNTTYSYSNAARHGFRIWLQQKYQSPDALNRAWGNVFWSMEAGSFEEIDLPNLTVAEANPAHLLDFRRYSSDQVVEFNRAQADILRRLSPGRDIVHNFMGKYREFDHFDVSRDLDVASWDSYPLGFLEQFGRNAAWKNWYLRAGDPDFQAFHHDLYRACGNMRGQGGRWWVMEQQPGPVNWAPWNPSPHDGMVRLWSHEAIAHGAEVVSYFRWRQAPFAQEQMHSGLNRPDNSPDQAFGEVRQVADDLENLDIPETSRADAALVFDYASIWAIQIQPQGADFDGFDVVLDFYSALRRKGLSVDIVPSGGDLSGYKLIVLPQAVIVSDELLQGLKKSDAQILIGPRSGSKLENFRIPEKLPPGPLQEIIPVKVERVESLRPGIGVKGGGTKWREFVSGDAKVEMKDAEGVPVLLSHGNAHYLATLIGEELLGDIVAKLAKSAGLDTLQLHEDIRVRDRGGLRWFFNYGPRPVSIDGGIGENDEIVSGGSELPVAGVTIVRRIPAN